MIAANSSKYGGKHEDVYYANNDCIKHVIKKVAKSAVLTQLQS